MFRNGQMTPIKAEGVLVRLSKGAATVHGEERRCDKLSRSSCRKLYQVRKKSLQMWRETASYPSNPMNRREPIGQ
ncbi:hypothetical protein PNOK_0306700 [Pyrrhoderma noxium]|uniref:Uncharacterized protein n=1 Tax=Pyrrhoderma noxium TaxID=2282107 RepID=A0A286ULJ0_9AGAM|nr:hypothetical protein PNOK_0306700 [Pyrrhoderma noxium]